MLSAQWKIHQSIANCISFAKQGKYFSKRPHNKLSRTSWSLRCIVYFLTFFSLFYLIQFLRYKLSKFITVGLVHCFNQAGLKMDQLWKKIKKIIQFFYIFYRFWSCLNFIEATYAWLLIGTSFTRNDNITRTNIETIITPWDYSILGL